MEGARAKSLQAQWDGRLARATRPPTCGSPPPGSTPPRPMNGNPFDLICPPASAHHSHFSRQDEIVCRRPECNAHRAQVREFWGEWMTTGRKTAEATLTRPSIC